MRATLRGRTPLRSAALALPLAAFIGFGIVSCKKPATGSAAPTTASSAVDTSASGPCAAYAERLCETAGTDSATCQSVKAATELMPPEACAAGMKNFEFSVKKIAAAGHACDELVQKLCEAVGPETQSC